VRFLLFLIMFGMSAAAQVQEPIYQTNLMPLNDLPTFDHGYLVVYDWDSRVDVFAPDGTLMYSVPGKVPGSDWAMIENGAVDSDGTMAAAVRGVSAAGRADGGGIALFDRTGTQIRFLDTGGYLPTQVAFGPDHSIWTIGYLAGKANLTADYSTLRNYAQDGKELGRFLPRASFPYGKDLELGEPLILPMMGGWELRVANERVEVILHRANLWVQTDLNGQEQGRWNISPNVPNGCRPYAITQDGRAWQRIDGRHLNVFDRSAGWRAVPLDVPEGDLLGAAGDSLVFLLADRHTLRWLPAPLEGLRCPDVLPRWKAAPAE
jgi:hypothetical protein